METRSRLVATSVLLLVVLAGSGLAIAADSNSPAPSNPPAATYLPKVVDPALARVDAAAENLAWAARDVMNNLQGLDVNATRTALTGGDAALANLMKQAAELAWDSPARKSAASLAQVWQNIKTRASNATNLLVDLDTHGAYAIQATRYGRQKAWSDALASLHDASTAMSHARRDRAVIGAAGTMTTLDDLMLRYDAYDTALTSLYLYMSKGHGQHSRKFPILHDAVTAAQAALPGGYGVFSIIVGDAAGTAIAASLAEISRARAEIDALLNPSAAPAQ